MKHLFKQKKTYLFLILGIVALVIAIIIGIDDNPPGIILSFISSVLFVLAFAHNFKSPKSYIILLLGSIIGFVILIILHNIFESFGEGTFLRQFGVFFFLGALFLCPAGIIVGVIGSLMNYYKK